MAQTQLYSRKAQICIKEEASQDTYQAPAGDGTDIFLADIAEVPMAITSSNHEPNYTRADYFKMDEIPGPAQATISFRFPLKYSGTAGTAPEFDEFFKACGLEVTNTPATSDVYAPLSTFDGAGGNPGPSYSCSVLENGIRWAIKGAFGTLTLTAEAGEPAYINGSMTGAYVAVADDGTESPTYQTTVAPAFLGASLAIGGATPKGVQSFEFDLGNQIRVGMDANDSSGFYGARITGRKSIGSVVFESELVATRDDFGLWRAGTVGAFTTGTIGSTAGNRWNLNIPRVVRRTPELQNLDGVRGLSMPFAVSSAATDVEGTNDDVTITFT